MAGGSEDLGILIEKDFQCLHKPGERDPDAYPHPLATDIGAQGCWTTVPGQHYGLTGGSI